MKPSLRISQRARWAAAAFAVYTGAIIASNWLIGHVGIPAGPGTHLTPVGFGLMAPSGVWAAAVSFPARDVLQRLTPRWHVTRGIGVPVAGIAAILIGAGVSYAVSSPVIALASGGTYLCSESLDMTLYTALQRRWLTAGVFVSCCAAITLDSALFLHWAGLWSVPAFEGLMLGKFWVILAATGIVFLLRRTRPLAVVPA